MRCDPRSNKRPVLRLLWTLSFIEQVSIYFMIRYANKNFPFTALHVSQPSPSCPGKCSAAALVLSLTCRMSLDGLTYHKGSLTHQRCCLSHPPHFYHIYASHFIHYPYHFSFHFLANVSDVSMSIYEPVFVWEQIFVYPRQILQKWKYRESGHGFSGKKLLRGFTPRLFCLHSLRQSVSTLICVIIAGCCTWLQVSWITVFNTKVLRWKTEPFVTYG